MFLFIPQIRLHDVDDTKRNIKLQKIPTPQRAHDPINTNKEQLSAGGQIPQKTMESIIREGTNLKITDLPNEILAKILFELYKSNHSIIPFISSSKELFYSFRYLIYLTKIIKITEYQHFFKGNPNPRDAKTYHILKFLHDNEDIASSVSVLKMRSDISVLSINNDKIEDSFICLLPITLPLCDHLILMNMTLNSPLLLFKMMKSLPSGLQILVLRLEFTRNHYMSIDMQKIVDEFQQGEHISKLNNLQYFEASSKFTDLTLSHIHPEIAKYRYNRETPEEITIARANNSIINRCYKLLRQITKESKVKMLIGQLIYSFFKTNNSELLKIEIMGIDLNLVFGELEKSVITFPKLRMLFFDRVTRMNMTKWLIRFQIGNSNITFKDSSPLLLLNDTIGNRLYFKSCSQIRENFPNGRSELESWSFSKIVRSQYALFMRSLELEY